MNIIRGASLAGSGAKLAVLASLVGLAACAPAPLYTSSGMHRGAVTWGEIPRDARGEPVWAAIRPTPGQQLAGQPADQRMAAARPMKPAAVQEGDGED